MQLLEKIQNDQKLIKILKEDGIVVIPTDTLYGIVGRAENPDVVLKICEIRKRNPVKPCIILIADVAELKKFSVSLSSEQEKILRECWPGPVSVILDCPDELFSYLHRGTKTLAFRLPKDEGLRDLLKQTGPLVAPSANMEGDTPAQNIKQAKKYFGHAVDLYVDGGELSGQPSKIIKLHPDGSLSIIRE